MEFSRESHWGAKRVDIAKEIHGEYFFSGKGLGKNLPPDVLKSWKEMAKGPGVDTTKERCSAGNYKFTFTNKQTETRYGCTQGKAYGKYIGELETIRRFAKGMAK